MENPKRKRERGRRRNNNSTDGSSGLSHTSLLFKDVTEVWYNELKDISERNQLCEQAPSAALVAEYRAKAEAIYQSEVRLFNQSQSSKDDRWVESTMKSGTLKDRIAAMSVVVSSNPIHKLDAMDGLLNMAGCSLRAESHPSTNSRVAQLAAEALQDLFLNTYLPPHRKLISLNQRPLNLYSAKKTASPRILVLWYLEELLAAKYQSFLSGYITNTLAQGMELDKRHALDTTAKLLMNAPQSEDKLLSMIVNKLGDSNRKVARTAGYTLHTILSKHSAMQTVVAREVQQLAHRPQLSPRALYNCICFLNQLTLSRHDTKLPVSLVKTYFGMLSLGLKDQSRLLAALLQGIHRAHPYLPSDNKSLQAHVDELYKVVHQASPASATQALLVLFHVSVGTVTKVEHDKKSKTPKKVKGKEAVQENGHEAQTHRFYRALFQVCGNDALFSGGKHSTMLFNLLYKALKYDRDESRALALTKRLLATTLHASAPVVAAVMVLVGETSKIHAVVREGMASVLSGKDALRYLDPLKREPRGAWEVMNDDGSSIKEEEGDVKASLWELALTCHHIHPSVQAFSRNIVDIDYTGDPIRDFGVAHFLDKFAYRNPKKVADNPARQSVVASKRQTASNSVPFNDASFLKKTNVEAPDQFFRIFFEERARRDQLKGSRPAERKPDYKRNKPLSSDVDFEELEQTWDSDQEEEAFVDSLAERIIEDSIQEHGPADLDDEDPDMEGWGDMYSDQEQDDGDSDSDDEIVGYEEALDGLEPDSSDDGSGGGDEVQRETLDVDDDEFMGNSDSSSGDEKAKRPSNTDSETDDESGLLLFSDEESVPDDDDSSEVDSGGGKRASDIFEDAEKYESMIDESWTDLIERQLPDREMAKKKRRKSE